MSRDVAGLARLLDAGPLPARASLVIVGAGITGLSFARWLSALGLRDMLIVERAYPGAGATGRNVARLRAMQLTEELCHVAVAAQATYDRMGEELGFNVLFYRLGYLWALYEAEEMERMARAVEMHHRLGIDSRLLAPDDVLRLVPVFRGGDPLAGGVVHDDAIVHHDAVVWAHLEHLAATGRVRIASGTNVVGVARGDGGVRAVLTDRGRVETRHVLNAADAWSNALNGLAAVHAPNRPLRREVLVTAPVHRAIDKAVTFYRPTEGWFNQTLRGEVVMGVVDPDEPVGHDQRSSSDFLRRTARLMVRKAPGLADLTVIRQWAGMYDVTPDHLPLVGQTGQLEGWWQANGWSGRGMLLAPYLTRLLAERFMGAEPHPHLALFEPDRFVGTGDAGNGDEDYYARYARPRDATRR
ncbi:MAG TPA: FAD-binding oxidoreductase [Candidatus Limnocylindrales bacterium]|nr:FAD-binding oxidoreductase [Candidatus Limnocylindrales bacterium]